MMKSLKTETTYKNAVSGSSKQIVHTANIVTINSLRGSALSDKLCLWALFTETSSCSEVLDETGVRRFRLALLKLATFQLSILIPWTSVKLETGRSSSLTQMPRIFPRKKMAVEKQLKANQ